VKEEPRVNLREDGEGTQGLCLRMQQGDGGERRGGGGGGWESEEHQGPLRRPDWRYRGPTLEPGLGVGARTGERLVAGSLPTGPGRAQPEMATWARLPVGSPPAGRSMRGRCNVVWVAVVAGGLGRPNPWTKTLAIGTWNVTSLGGKEPELEMREVERYRLEIVGLTSTHSLGSGTQLLERAGPSTTLELPRVSGGELVWACL
ncbi:hypothetical protein L3Q82_011284, partial [Scortum barcoo]